MIGSNHYPLPAVPLAEGAATVLINGFPMGRVGIRFACGGAVKTGSANVIIGGPTAVVATIISAESILETGLQLLGKARWGPGRFWLPPLAARSRLANLSKSQESFLLPSRGFTAGGDSLGPGWADITTGLAGFGLLAGGVAVAKRSVPKLPGEPDPTWDGEFWPDSMGRLPPAERTIEVDAANVRATKPELARAHGHAHRRNSAHPRARFYQSTSDES